MREINNLLSIIIPALNEEKQLPLLLESIRTQNFKNYEIILADSGSKDRTREIAKEFGCKITKGGSPAKGRNEGAKAAKGDLLLFLDADVFLPEGFLKKVLEEFSGRRLDGANFFLCPDRGFFAKILFNVFYNLLIFATEPVLAHCSMGGLVKKDIFERIGGFDESITLAEDHYFARQVKKIGRYGVIKSTKIFVSTRRFSKDGWLKTGLKYFLCELYMVFFGPVKKNLFKYNFKHLEK